MYSGYKLWKNGIRRNAEKYRRMLAGELVSWRADELVSK
jgi:hypothetical protein